MYTPQEWATASFTIAGAVVLVSLAFMFLCIGCAEIIKAREYAEYLATAQDDTADSTAVG